MHSPRPQWMLAGSLRLIYARADNCFRMDYNQNVAHPLTRAIIKSVAVDTCRRAEVATDEIGAYLDSPQGILSNLQKAYSKLM